MNNNSWRIGENFTAIHDEDSFSTQMNHQTFKEFINKLKDLKVEDRNIINNAIALLEDQRDTINFVSEKCKVGALTHIENVVNSKLGY
jgi:hypothetical protein